MTKKSLISDVNEQDTRHDCCGMLLCQKIFHNFGGQFN